MATYDGEEIVQRTPYDNDVTLLYKWGKALEVPIELLIVRPRKDTDEQISGTEELVFESLPMIVDRLANEGETPATMYNIINGYTKKIDKDDVVMAYYDRLKKIHGEYRDLYKDMNDAHREMDERFLVDMYENNGDVQHEYDAWISKYEIDTKRDFKRLETILEIQEILEEVNQREKIPVSPINITSTVISFRPTLDNRKVVRDDGVDIFDQAVVSTYIPYIRYNNKYGASMYKVFTGEKIDKPINYSVTMMRSNELTRKNTIYMTLWLGDPTGEGISKIQDSPSESFYKVEYHLDTNYLTIESPVGKIPKYPEIIAEELAVQRTKNALPSLEFGEGEEVKVKGEFNMWGMEYDESSFLDMVLLQPALNVYLYVEENKQPFALKKRLGLDVHYRSIYSDKEEGETITQEAYVANYASISVILNKKTTSTAAPVEIYDPVEKTVTNSEVESGFPYIQVNITRAESRKALEDFIFIFTLLMRYYVDNKEDVIEEYNRFLPELGNLEFLLANKKQKNKTVESTVEKITKKIKKNEAKSSKTKNDILQDKAPELFINNYSRSLCQSPFQPIIIENDEVDAWQEQFINNTEIHRQVMTFPKEGPSWNFVCYDEQDEKPYPGVRVNHLSNKDRYPYLPCCFRRDQMSPGIESHYSNYMKGIEPDRAVGAKAQKKISTSKILTPGKVAFLPRAVQNIVKIYSDEHVDMVRYGIIYSPNSLLHCVCLAVDDPNYITLVEEENKELYVSRLRRYISLNINPSLMKQELFDHTDEEILSLLRDNTKFLDPALFYRAIEEIFNINIYTFTLSKPAIPSGDDIQLGSFDVPRFNVFHSRPLRPNRPTVVIMKNLGSESDSLDYPQCELIVDYDEPNQRIMKLFGPSMTEVCQTALQDSLRTMTWFSAPNFTFKVHSNIYSFIDHLSLFQFQAVSQFIDYNGKLRGLILKVNQKQLLTIATLPSQPENLPLATDITEISYDIATSIFGEPTGVTRNSSGELTGLWFQIMDITFGEYVPVIPVPGIFDTKPLGPPNPILSTGKNLTNRLSKLRRDYNIIKQVTRWLFDLARRQRNIDYLTFASEFMVQDISPVPDSSLYYDLSKIPRRLPYVENVEDAIQQLEPLCPTLFDAGHLVMYNSTFSDRITKMLLDYSNLRIGLPIKIAEFIENFYETESDFIQIPNSKIFLNEKDLQSWLLSVKNLRDYSSYFNINSTIQASMGFSLDPYLYKDDDGKIYIIQNVVGGLMLKALSVAKTWYEYSYNIGSDPEPLDEVPVHMIYGISPSSTIIPIEDHAVSLNVFLKILYYGSPSDKSIGKTSRYAAMLEIL